MYRKQNKDVSSDDMKSAIEPFGLVKLANSAGFLYLEKNIQKSYLAPFNAVRYDINNAAIQTNKIGFFFDLNKFLIENSNFPSIFNSTDEIRDIGISNSRIVEVKITRVRIDHKNFLDNKEEELIAQEITADDSDPDHFKVHIKNLSSLPELLFVTCTDPGLFYKTYGIFKYKTYISVQDGGNITIHNLYNQTLQYIKNIEEALLIGRRPIIVNNIIKDLNPHIDSDDEFNSLKINNGFYNITEDVFDKTLEEINGFRASDINQYIRHYIQLRKLFIFANNKNINKNIVEEEIAELEKYLRLVISPGTGNPDGVLLFVDLMKQACELLSSMDSGFSFGQDSEQPKFASTIHYEHTFQEEVNADLEKNVGFEYFRDVQDIPGINIVKNSSIVKNMLGYQNLQNIVFPINNEIVRLDIFNNFGLSVKDDILSSYCGLDIALSLYGYPEFHSVAVSSLASRYASMQSEESIKKDLIYKTIADSNILANNNITIEFPQLNKDKITTKSEIRAMALDANIDYVNLFKSRLSRELTFGILNTAKRHKGEALSSYYNRLVQYKTKPDQYPFINTTEIGIDIEESSTLKIKYETAAKIYGITFNRDQRGYNLKDIVYVDINEASLDLDHLCILRRYTNDSLDINEPTFAKIPTFNEFFILTNELDSLPYFTLNKLSLQNIRSLIKI